KHWETLTKHKHELKTQTTTYTAHERSQAEARDELAGLRSEVERRERQIQKAAQESGAVAADLKSREAALVEREAAIKANEATLQSRASESEKLVAKISREKVDLAKLRNETRGRRVELDRPQKDLERS